jgi:hypothetical protein
MKIVERPGKVVAGPQGTVGNHIVTVEENGKKYAYVRLWRAPWVSPNAEGAGRGMFAISASGDIDFNQPFHDILTEVETALDKPDEGPRK